jgi:uncharacterized protein (DUF427 family)
MKPVKIPNADHAITITSSTLRVVVTVGGRIVADTRAALTLHEADFPPVHYIPRNDVDMSLLERTDHATYCPYKGECAYYSIPPIHHQNFAGNEKPRWYGILVETNQLKPAPTR